jgi:LPXTG-site transpeptidase (sortase) family protein
VALPQGPPGLKIGHGAPAGPRLARKLLRKLALVAVCLLTLACSPSAPAANAGSHRHAQLESIAGAEITAPPPVPDATPIRLLIPRISLTAAVEAQGLDGQRNLATPRDFREVAWYDQGPLPGVPGNAIINGHVNWWTGAAVFARLGELRPGDAVTVVRQDGSRATFRVTRLRTLSATTRDGSLFAPSQTSTLTLITCSGWWDLRLGSDTDRLLVSADLV